MNVYLFILSISLFFTNAKSQGPTISGQCNTTQIDACLMQIHLVPSSLLEQPISDEKLASICGNLIKAKSCFAENAKNCFKSQLEMQLTNIDIVDYICTDEGKKGLKEAVICSTTPNYLASFSECNDKISPLFTADVNIIGNICKRNNALYSCYVNSSKTCNLEAFVTNFYKKILGRELDVYECDLDFRNWDTQVYSQCNFAIIPECLLTAYTPDISLLLVNPLDFKLLSTTQVNKACRAVDSFINCVIKNAKCEETIPVVQVLLSLAKAYDYLCKIDRSGFDKFASCFNKNPSIFDSCAKSSPSNCSSLLSLQKCLTDASAKTCGFSSTIDNYIYKTYQPIWNQTVGGCNLIPPTKTSTHTNVPPTKTSTLTNEADGNIQSIFLIFFLSILIYNV